MDQDGITDIGLYVPQTTTGTTGTLSDWYFWLSNDPATDTSGNPLTQKRITGQVNTLDHPLSSVSLGGADLFAQLGNSYALPIVGNFDPSPAAATTNGGSTTGGSTTGGATTTVVPTIGAAAVSFANGFMSWSVADPNGVAGSQLVFDGKSLPQSSIYGPYAASSGVTYAGVFGKLAPGSTHTYLIAATDKLGHTAQESGQFTVPGDSGPTISAVAFNTAHGFMSWNEADPNGIAGTQLAIDGHALSSSAVYGPYAASSGATYAGAFGTLAAGAHSYVITATDKLGVTSTKTGQFTVPAAPAPVITAVAVNFAQKFMSWNEADANGIAGTQISIDGQTLGKSAMYGPYAASSGVTYAAVFGTLAPGAHTYVITATDKLGGTSTLSGQFNVPASAPVPASAGGSSGSGSSTGGGSSQSNLARSIALKSLTASAAQSAKVAWAYDAT